MDGKKRKFRILGISGGRPNSNNDALCKQALSAAASRGAEVRFVRLPDLTIHDCYGCFSCAETMARLGLSRCIIKDDFDWLREEMLDADGVIFSLPVFRLGAPAAFLRLIERLGIRDDIGRYFIQLKSSTPPADTRILRPRPVLYMGTGGTDLSSRFDADCRLFSTVTMWPALDVICFDWTRSVFYEKEKLIMADAAGLRLMDVLNGDKNLPRPKRDGICPKCGGDNLKLHPDSLCAECCSCGLLGKIELRAGRLFLQPDQDRASHCFGSTVGKIQHTLDVTDNNELRAKMRKDPEWQETKRHFQRSWIVPQRPIDDGAEKITS